uniref:Spondin-2-like n=1 Tax=Callorhinchus milii TaxID=7868 RepID=A0A4W3J1U0_CALMI
MYPSTSLLLLIASSFSLVQASNRTLCRAEEPANYSVKFSAEWNTLSFPKQYPTHRPPAQWSLLFGCVHSDDFTLWAEGDMASAGVKLFAEDGNPDLLLEEVNITEVVFTADPITLGEGNTCTMLTATPSHPLVSFLVRVIPSPDWFLGASRVNLCEGDEWRESISLDLFPWDAGTDSGFTFSSPNFPTSPQEPVFKITAKHPSHPVNSFFYPRLESLPRMELPNQPHSPLSPHTPDQPHSPTWRKGLNTTPLDCEVSNWSTWGLCSHRCGISTRQRTRYIVQLPANAGDPCPALLIQENCEEVKCPMQQQYKCVSCGI